MDIKIKGFILPHNEEPYYTCADRYAVNTATVALAIADGVGGSLYPSFLSERITKDFVNNPAGLIDGNKSLLNKDYAVEFDEYYKRRYSELPIAKQQILDLKTEQTKASSCTFVGCYVEKNVWKYYSLGDSYLFFIANDGTMKKYSSMDGKNFDVFPEYFSTNGKHNGTVQHGEFPLQDGVMLLMTDALSDWFIKYFEKDKSLLNRLLSLKTHKEYVELCSGELAAGRLSDDDCAILIATISNSKNTNVSFVNEHIDDITDLSIEELQTRAKATEEECKKKGNELQRLRKDKEFTEQKLAEMERERKKFEEDKKTEIDELKRQINISPKSHPVPQSIVLDNEIKHLTDSIQHLEEYIKQNKNDEGSTQLAINQTLTDISKGIEKLVQYIEEKKDKHEDEKTAEEQEVKDNSKKKLIWIFLWIQKHITIVFDVTIIILLIFCLLTHK